MSVLKMFSPDEDKSYNSKDGKEAEKKWVAEYKNKFNLPYKLSVVEKSILKKLIVEFGLTNVNKVIEYYVNNYENISYIKGHPSINAMMGFRRTLFPEVLLAGKEDFSFKIQQGGKDNGDKTCW